MVAAHGSRIGAAEHVALLVGLFVDVAIAAPRKVTADSTGTIAIAPASAVAAGAVRGAPITFFLGFRVGVAIAAHREVATYRSGARAVAPACIGRTVVAVLVSGGVLEVVT